MIGCVVTEPEVQTKSHRLARLYVAQVRQRLLAALEDALLGDQMAPETRAWLLEVQADYKRHTMKPVSSKVARHVALWIRTCAVCGSGAVFSAGLKGFCRQHRPGESTYRRYVENTRIAGVEFEAERKACDDRSLSSSSLRRLKLKRK